MKKSIISIPLALLFVFAASSCSKYEDGPAISLRSKKARIANDWKIEKAYDNGNDVSNSFDQYELTMTKDGDAQLDATYDFDGFIINTKTDGTWDFTNDKEQLELDFENDDADGVYQILRLKENELWLREKGEDLELQLVTK